MDTAPLDALCTRISSGGTPSRKHPEYFSGEDGHLWVKSQELIDRPIFDTSEKISDLGLRKSSAKYYDEDTVLIAMYGATVGQLGILKSPATVNQAICALCVDPEVADFRYVFYALMATRHDLTIQAAGAAQQNLNQGLIRSFEIPIISLDKQRSIAAILGDLDDLIENNRRRIEILEEMARLTYREWFVHFRFPGHEDVELVDSDLGPIPEGWDVLPVGTVVDTAGGGTPAKKKPEYWEDPSIVWYTPSDLTKQPAMFAFGSGDEINELGLSKSSAKLFPPRTVMMTSRATIGEIAISTTEASTNQGFISCVPNDRLSEYHLYFWLQDNVELFHTLAGGATFKELRKSTFRDLPIAVPTPEIEGRFNDAVGPMCQLVENLLRQNAVLSEARDLLLPRLISGELDVSDLDLDLESVA